VILHRTVPSDISGVMVTTDLEDHVPDSITISASEGVAAVVDGGAPETLVVLKDGAVHRLASSRTATRKIIPSPPAEGVVVLGTERVDPLLSASQIIELRGLANEVTAKVASPGRIPWDIEFGIANNQAYLMQLRPLNVSDAGLHPYLLSLDAAAATSIAPLKLGDEVPK
jgi:hypothetical protein